MVMRGDSRSKGRGFESRRRILDGHFFTLICCKNCIVCLKRPKINGKEAGVGPFFKKNKLNTLLAPLFKKFTEQYFLFIVQQSGIQGSGGGSVGRAVTTDSRGPRFESCHWQKFYIKNLP